MSMKNNKLSGIVGVVLASMLIGGSAISAPEIQANQQSETKVCAAELNVGSDWVVKTKDSVVGVSDARQITNPAKVDYSKLLKATPEMKEIKKEGIDKSSARGQTLVTQAQSRIARASRAIMTAKGYCGVWKKISHKQKQAVTDITDLVKAKLSE
jgi:hypothetical protein